jgi:hypothetical protein
MLDGFTYGRIVSGATNDVDKMLDWLDLQPKSPFCSRPYVQMAKVLRDSGDDHGSRCVLEQMERLRRADTARRLAFPLKWAAFPLKWASRFSSVLLRWTIGYGLYPLRALLWLLLIILLGWAVYGYSDRMIAPTDQGAYENLRGDKKSLPPHYPEFSPLVFSIENSLPFIKLGQVDKWQPDHSAQVLVSVQRIQIGLGWLLSAFFVAGVSGIVRKE